MAQDKDFYNLVARICEEDRRYKPDAYEFMLQALYFTQDQLKREGHVTGKELSEGARKFIIEKYGPMARTVLNHWGIKATEDFGNIVFNLIAKKMLSKTEKDSPDDFREVYDFAFAFGNVLRESIIKEKD